MKTKLFPLLCMAILLGGCKKDDPASTLTIRPESLTFEYNGNPLNGNHFTIQYDSDWLLSGEADWVTFDRVDGRGEALIEVTVTPNPNAAREATFRVTGNQQSAPITIKQNASTLLEVIPDPTFRAYCLEHFDTNSDGTLSTNEFQAVKTLNLTVPIQSLKGIEHFTALEELSCLGLGLTELNLSGNPQLKKLYCSDNQLTKLDLSANTHLIEFLCNNNRLTALDLSPLTELTIFSCRNNQLEDLNLSANTALKEFYCDKNELSTLDLSANTTLTIFYCLDNQLTKLDLSANTALIELRCSNNTIGSLDLSKNTALKYVVCEYNQQLASLICPSPALELLNCRGNSLTELDAGQNPSLYFLDCVQNPLTQLDVTKNPGLEYLYCFNDQLTSLDIANNLKLGTLFCNGNPELNTVYVWAGFDLANPTNSIFNLSADEHTAFQIKK